MRALREGGLTRALMAAVAAACFGCVGLLAVMEFHPAGPVGVVGRSVQVAVMLVGMASGLRWALGRFPRYPMAVAFVAWADVSVAAAAATMSTPESRLCATLYMGLVGVFAAFLLGRRILFAHCAFGSAAILAITASAVLAGDASAFGLFIYYVPALIWVVVVPLGGLVLIDGGRRAIDRTARSAHYDPLTGLRNRRGFCAAIGMELSRGAPSTTVLMAVCDVDRFKALNDAHGHAVGDAALVAMAQRLASLTRPGEIAARIGGDELVLALVRGERAEPTELMERLSPLTWTEVDSVVLTASIGIASQTTGDPYFSIDDALRRADAAMYEAKRSGGANCVLHAASGSDAAVGDAGRVAAARRV